MVKIGLVYSDEYLKHETRNHPESAQRLNVIISALKQSALWNDIELIEPGYADEKDILTVHTPQLIKIIKKAIKEERAFLDMDTQISPDSYSVALLAAGGVIRAVDTVMNTQINRTFCAVRPPGHHATSDLSMGFCLLNNIAIGARYAIRKYNLERILIIDWDLHHGNGTQDIFYNKKDVFYISLHQFPHFPGTGSDSETGSGEGKGYTLNFPMKAGFGEKDYMDKLNNEIDQAVSSYKPQLILISAGFDAHHRDPLGMINLSSDSYFKITLKIKEFAEKYTGGRMISVLEGGYDLPALQESVLKHMAALR
ncbi:MAG: histone deacetylase [Spirochaetes bacterium]|nr:histone deacetylase [Spirochaetota bacterium]